MRSSTTPQQTASIRRPDFTTGFLRSGWRVGKSLRAGPCSQQAATNYNPQGGVIWDGGREKLHIQALGLSLQSCLARLAHTIKARGLFPPPCLGSLANRLQTIKDNIVGWFDTCSTIQVSAIGLNYNQASINECALAHNNTSRQGHSTGLTTGCNGHQHIGTCKARIT